MLHCVIVLWHRDVMLHCVIVLWHRDVALCYRAVALCCCDVALCYLKWVLSYEGLIFACTLLGLAASNLNEKGRLFLDLIESVSATVIAVVRWFLWTTPVGVISLIGVSLASAEHVGEVFSRLGLFIASITAGIIFQQLVLMSGVYFALTRRNPYKYLISIARPWMISFASTTTAVAIPEMLAACEDKNRIDKRVSRFVIPFSVTINRSGSALYISGATVFVANVTGTELHIGDVLLIWLSSDNRIDLIMQ
ncbi:excitatory amino acid transporter 3-like [Mercenaria mercenaria]|uniref:excitatory amino acid transporter 3-like n=1 Tax=Mercenaria mercenaria TaxID=6596 RepID=UPI00234F3FD5|nr:excitatory amino acid transporter 3-like [Mercenaria mercenaria]